jgi:hypothetical protein
MQNYWESCHGIRNLYFIETGESSENPKPIFH